MFAIPYIFAATKNSRHKNTKSFKTSLSPTLVDLTHPENDIITDIEWPVVDVKKPFQSWPATLCWNGAHWLDFPVTWLV